MGRARVVSNVMQWSTSTEKKLDLAVLQMATDILRTAVIFAPRDTSALANSGQVIREGAGKYSVKFGGGGVPYARRRHYENKKNPQTLRYLERAGDGTFRNSKRYFRGIT